MRNKLIKNMEDRVICVAQSLTSFLEESKDNYSVMKMFSIMFKSFVLNKVYLF